LRSWLWLVAVVLVLRVVLVKELVVAVLAVC
jgi:hypothetical protein